MQSSQKFQSSKKLCGNRGVYLEKNADAAITWQQDLNSY